MATSLEITDLVTYKGEKYRIVGFKKRIEESEFMAGTEPLLLEIFQEIVEEERQKRKSLGLPHERRYRYKYCTKEEATHASLYGALSTTAPIEEIIYEGPINWPENLIKESKESAEKISNHPACCFSDWRWE